MPGVCFSNNGNSLTITEALSDIQRKLGKLDRMETHCKKIPGLVSDVDKMKKDILSIKASIGDTKVMERLDLIDKEIKAIKDITTQPGEDKIDYSSEIEGRRRKAHNMYFHNLEDKNDKKDDLDRVSSLIKELLKIDVDISTTVRTGKRVVGVHRPLLVVHKDPEDVRKIMAKKKNISQVTGNPTLSRKLNVTTDKTFLQRQQLKKCIEEVNALKAEGKTDVNIKFRIGRPTVVEGRPTSRGRPEE